MGFWSGLAKIVQGKPVFEAPEGQGSPAVVEASSANASGRKIIPELLVSNCESRVSGTEMETTAWVTNKSAVEIELDKIVILGITIELDRFLLPGKGQQLRLYKGAVAPSDKQHKASLYYKQVNNGDYFCADFTIEFDYDSQGFYTIEEFHPIHPVRDV